MSGLVEIFTGKKQRRRAPAGPSAADREAEERRRANRDARRRASQLRRGPQSTILTGGAGFDETVVSQRTILGG